MSSSTTPRSSRKRVSRSGWTRSSVRKNRVKHLVAGRVHEARLSAGDAEPRGGVEHFVEPVVEGRDTVLKELLLIHHRAYAILARREVVELEEDPLNEREVFEDEPPLRVPFTHALDVVHLDRDVEVAERPVLEEARRTQTCPPGGAGAERRR